MKSIVSLITAGIGAMAFAVTEFPYGVTEMTERNRSKSLDVESFAAPAEVEKISDMPETDAIATVTAARMAFVAADEANWAASVAKIGASQAGLAVRYANGAFHWMGATANGWVELTGVEAAEGEWDVSIDIDYSLGVGKRKVRYMIDGVVLSAGDDVWLPLGAEEKTFGHVRFYGEGRSGAVVAKSAEREMQGTFTPSEDFGLNCNDLKVDIGLEDAWGIDSAEVSLRDEFGEIVARQMGVVDGDVIRVDFSDVKVAGGRYSYEVKLSGDYNGKKMGRDIVDIPPLVVGRDVDWFSFIGSGFDRATATDIVIANDAFAALSGKTGKVNPDETAPDASEVVLEATLEMQGVYQWDALPNVSSQFAITLARTKNADAMKLGTRTWVCKNGEGNWEAVSVNGLPVDNGQYDVKVVLDYRDGQRKGVYFVRQHGDDHLYLKLAEFSLAEMKLSRAAILGGNVTALIANYTTAIPAELEPPTGDTIVISGNTKVDIDKLSRSEYSVEGVGKKSHLTWIDKKEDGATVKYAKMSGGRLTVYEGAPANGLESFASHALGLDPTKELAKPAAVVKAGGMQSGKGVTVHVPNVVPANLPDAGVTVVHRLQRSADKGQTWTDTGTEVGAGESLVVPFESGVLYRVNTVLK